MNLFNRKQPPESEVLGPREWQVMLLLATGYSVMEAGKKLGIQGKTVSTYRDRILQKTGLKNNVEIALQAYAQGLIRFENKRAVVCDLSALAPHPRSVLSKKDPYPALDLPVAESRMS